MLPNTFPIVQVYDFLLRIAMSGIPFRNNLDILDNIAYLRKQAKEASQAEGTAS